ncbi:MAG TPA: DnaJ domain-containing protein [Candidatus Acidoferrales bacterium]
MGKEQEPSNRRKYPRFRASKGMLVGWKSARQSSTSHAGTVSLGGIYLHAADPPVEGSPIELILELPTGQIRARAVVRNLKSGKGMGVQFIQMNPQDRAKLNKYLSLQEQSQQGAAASAPSTSKGRPANSQLAVWYRREEAAQFQFEQELTRLIELTGKSTYYQLLGVTSDSPPGHVKKSYHSLARKFHPDNHMGKRELIGPLKELMAVITEAYKTLANDEKRAAYDKRLAASGAFTMHRGKARTAESVEDWFKRANDSLRAKNFVGSVVWLRKCVEASPGNAVYHALLARSLSTVPQYRKEAIVHFRKAIELDPWKETVYIQFAELCEKMELPDLTRAVYSKLLEVNPAHPEALERLEAIEAGRKGKKAQPLISQLLGKKN